VEREVDDERDEADEDGEREDAGGDGAAAPPEEPVVVGLLLAHDDRRGIKLTGWEKFQIQVQCGDGPTDDCSVTCIWAVGASRGRRPFKTKLEVG
jgi:hypothetical protein